MNTLSSVHYFSPNFYTSLKGTISMWFAKRKTRPVCRFCATKRDMQLRCLFQCWKGKKDGSGERGGGGGKSRCLQSNLTTCYPHGCTCLNEAACDTGLYFHRVQAGRLVQLTKFL